MPELLTFLQLYYDVFQVDAIAYPGNSGILSMVSGKVGGIINKTRMQGGARRLSCRISVAIVIRYAKALLAKAGL